MSNLSLEPKIDMCAEVRGCAHADCTKSGPTLKIGIGPVIVDSGENCISQGCSFKSNIIQLFPQTNDYPQRHYPLI